MDPSHLAPGPMDDGKKQRAIQDAKDMAEFIVHSAARAKCAVPPYDFLELIGKGGSGRVYKCRSQATGDLVAIKIINTDEIDYVQHALDKDDTIRDFKKEVSILNQLRDSNAKNVNMIHDAFAFQEQLWIVCDYCTGGSVRTLLRARPDVKTGLEESYVITIARELAWAMKSVHDINIIHRDIKCTNVYINEHGDIQLGDFGIVGITDEGISKRRTIIGTPHYMPPELHLPSDGNQAPNAYGKEIDVWSFGCSVFEMATGQPPNSHITNMNQLNRQLRQDAPRLEGENYSPELCAFVAYCLDRDPVARPTADDILKHPYIANTEKAHPTSNLIRLIERYKFWEYGGGQRASLWMPGGAPDVPSLSEAPPPDTDGDDDDWNFSTSDDFDEAFGKRYSQMIETQDHAYTGLNASRSLELPPLQTQEPTPWQQHMQRREDRSATRGEVSLNRLWTTDSDSAPYELHTPVELPITEDLPLRSAYTAPARESVIDLDEGVVDSSAPVTLEFSSDMPTLKASRFGLPSYGFQDDEQDYDYDRPEDDMKRATMEWTFPKLDTSRFDDEEQGIGLATPEEKTKLAPPFRPMLKHTVTEPIGQFGDYLHTSEPLTQLPTPDRSSTLSMIDLDMSGVDTIELPRPSTASSTTGSTMTDMTSGNPFDLEDDHQKSEAEHNRHSYHKQWQSEGGHLKQRNSRKSIPMHTRGNSLSSTDSELDRMSRSEPDIFDKEYKVRVRNSIRRPLHSQQASDTTDTESDWPSFNSSFSSISQPGDRSHRQDTRRPSDFTSAPRSVRGGNEISQTDMFRVRQSEVEFPSLAPPHPDTLTDDADRQLVMAEMNRFLDEFSESLAVTTDVLKQFTGWDEQDDIPEDDESFIADGSGLHGGDELP